MAIRRGSQPFRQTLMIHNSTVDSTAKSVSVVLPRLAQYLTPYFPVDNFGNLLLAYDHGGQE